MNNNMYSKVILLTVLSLAVHIIPGALLILLVILPNTGALARIWLYSLPAAAIISFLMSVLSLIFSDMAKKEEICVGTS